MAIPLRLEIGRTYAVTSPVDCIVVGASGTVLCNHQGGTQQTFFVASEISATASPESVNITAVFRGAPAGNGNGGGEQPASPAVTELEAGKYATLQDGRVYHIEAQYGIFDYGRFLTVAPNATARIWVDYVDANLTFPADWVWSDSSEFQLPAGAAGGVGDFVDGETYLITVCRYKYGEKDFVIAHRALTIKPATA